MTRRCTVVSLQLIALLLLLPNLIPAENEAPPPTEPGRHYPVNAALFFPLSVNRSVRDTATVNLTLLYGRVGRVRGLDLAAGVSGVGGVMEGVQLAGLGASAGNSARGVQAAGLAVAAGDLAAGLQAAGLFAVAGDRLEGVQLAGLGVICGEAGRGLQAAGLFAIAGEGFRGLQAAGLMSVSGGEFRGIQGAGIFNVAGDDGRGLQGGGIFNATGGNFTGLQAAGLFNVVGETARGLQAACVNVANRSAGLQLGIVNVARTASGMQVGIVNYARRAEGPMVGLVNLARNGRVRAASWGGSLMAVNAGAKFMAGRFYSVLFLGGVKLPGDGKDSLAYGAHWGVQLPIPPRRRLHLAMDAGYAAIDNRTWLRSRKGTTDHQALMLRALALVDLSRKLSVFFGPGLRHLWERGTALGDGQTRLMACAGLEFL